MGGPTWNFGGGLTYPCHGTGSSTNLRKYSIAIRFLNDLLKKIQMEKNHILNTNRALRVINADKTTVLLSHLRNNYAFIVGYCC